MLGMSGLTHCVVSASRRSLADSGGRAREREWLCARPQCTRPNRVAAGSDGASKSVPFVSAIAFGIWHRRFQKVLGVRASWVRRLTARQVAHARRPVVRRLLATMDNGLRRPPAPPLPPPLIGASAFARFTGCRRLATARRSPPASGGNQRAHASMCRPLTLQPAWRFTFHCCCVALTLLGSSLRPPYMPRAPCRRCTAARGVSGSPAPWLLACSVDPGLPQPGAHARVVSGRRLVPVHVADGRHRAKPAARPPRARSRARRGHGRARMSPLPQPSIDSCWARFAHLSHRRRPRHLPVAHRCKRMGRR